VIYLLWLLEPSSSHPGVSKLQKCFYPFLLLCTRLLWFSSPEPLQGVSPFLWSLAVPPPPLPCCQGEVHMQEGSSEALHWLRLLFSSSGEKWQWSCSSVVWSAIWRDYPTHRRELTWAEEFKHISTVWIYVNFQRRLDAKNITMPFQHRRHWRCKLKDVAHAATWAMASQGHHVSSLFPQSGHWKVDMCNQLSVLQDPGDHPRAPLLRWSEKSQ